MNSKKMRWSFLSILIFLTLITFVSSMVLEPSFEESFYNDPVLGLKEFNLEYPSLVDTSQDVLVILNITKASKNNDFALFSNLHSEEEIPFETYDYTINRTIVVWRLNLRETEEFVLTNALGQMMVFKIEQNKELVEFQTESKYPSIVFPEKEFMIEIKQKANSFSELRLDPYCELKTIQTTIRSWVQYFNCSINEKTTFNLFKFDESIDTFDVNVYPADYCSPVCEENSVCEKNVCKPIGERVEDTVSDVNQLCSSGDFCDNQTLICQEGLVCLKNKCINKTVFNSINLIIQSNITEQNSSEETTDLLNDYSSEVTESLSDKLVDESFKDILQTKIEVPSLAKEVFLPTEKQYLHLEIDEERLFETINKKEIIIQNVSDETSKRLTKILTRERLIKTTIKEQQEKAKEKVLIEKEIVYEKEKSVQNKPEKISTKVIITVKPTKNLTTLDVVEVIPKEFVESAKELIFNIQPIILEDDPIIMWHLEDISEPVELTYRVEKNSSLTGNTIILSDDVSVDFDWKTLLPLLFVPLIAGMVISFSKFEDFKKQKEQKLKKM